MQESCQFTLVQIVWSCGERLEKDLVTIESYSDQILLPISEMRITRLSAMRSIQGITIH